MLNVVSVSNLNIEIVSPECTISFAYHEKWLAIQCTPFILILSGVLFHYIVLARKQLCGCLSKFKKRKHGDMNRHLNAIVGSIILLFYFCYIYCTKVALEVFACEKKENGISYMKFDASIVCWTEYPHTMMWPVALLCTFIYGAGIPAVFFIIAYKNREMIRGDQLLRVIGVGGSRKDNPKVRRWRDVHCVGVWRGGCMTAVRVRHVFHSVLTLRFFVPVVPPLKFYEFRKRFHKLYYRFKPKYYYWTSVILARKFLIVVVTVFLHDNPALQASCAILILFLSYSIHMRVLPYLRNDLLMNLSPDVDGATPAHPLIANIVNAKRDHHRLNNTRSSGLGAIGDNVNESGSNRVVPNYGGRKKGGSQGDEDDDHPHSEANLTHLMSLVNSNPSNISIVSTLRKGVTDVVRKKKLPIGASGRAHSKSLGGKALDRERQPPVMWAHPEDISWSCKKEDGGNERVRTAHSLPGRMHHSQSSPARAESTAREDEADGEGGAAAAVAAAMEKDHFRPLGAASARRKTGTKQLSTLGGKRGGGDGEKGTEPTSQHDGKEDGDTNELVDTFGEPTDDDRQQLKKSPMVRRTTDDFKSYRHTSPSNAEGSTHDASPPEETEQSKDGGVVRNVGGKSLKLTRSFSKRISNTVTGMVGESARDASVNHLKQSKHFMMDYNTMESVLLFCSICILLAGVMFEAGVNLKGKKTDGRTVTIQVLTADEQIMADQIALNEETQAKLAGTEPVDGTEYVLTVAVIMIVVFSSVYFFAVLLSEVGRSLTHFCAVRKVNNKRGKEMKRRKTDAKALKKKNENTNREAGGESKAGGSDVGGGGIAMGSMGGKGQGGVGDGGARFKSSVRFSSGLVALEVCAISVARCETTRWHRGCWWVQWGRRRRAGRGKGGGRCQTSGLTR